MPTEVDTYKVISCECAGMPSDSIITLAVSEGSRSSSSDGSDQDSDFSDYEDHVHTSDEEEEPVDDRSRKDRRQRAQEAMHDEESRTHPRTLGDVEAAIDGGKLLELSSRHKGKDEIVLQIYELAEFRNAEIDWVNNEAERVRAKIIPRIDATSAHDIIASWNDTEQRFVIIKSEVYSASDARQPKRSSTLYTPARLARIPAILSAFKNKPSLSKNEIQVLLKPYLNKEVSDGQINTIRKQLKDIISGKVEIEIPKLALVIKFLNDEGHLCTAVRVSKTKLIDTGMKFQKGRFTREQEKLPADDPKRRRWRNVEPQIRQGFEQRFSDGISDDAQFCFALSIGFRTSRRMLPLLFPVLYSDATHNKGASAGTMTYATIALDADHHIVALLCTYCVGEESAEGWGIHMDALVRFLEGLPLEVFLIIIDGIPAGIKACEERGFCTFLCSKHLTKHMTHEEQEVYLKALHARTHQKLLAIQDRLPDFFKKLEGKHLQRQLYMLMSGRVAGQHTQSAVESFNAMLDRKARHAVHSLGEM